MSDCRICGGVVTPFFDFGRQPMSDAFLTPEELPDEFFFRLEVGVCGSCTMVQQLEELPRRRMFHERYPYRSSGSAFMRRHFRRAARELVAGLPGPDPLVVEIGCNDGVLLRSVRDAGVRHVGVEPSAGVARVARDAGLRVRAEFFDESSAAAIRAADGPADVVYAANTISHIPYLDSVFRGVDTLLGPDGTFVFEDRHLGEILRANAFDQIYDEHFYLFSATSVQAVAERFGFVLAGVRQLDVHGGAVRYTLARAGRREPAPAVAELVARERADGLADPATFATFAGSVKQIREDLVGLLGELRAQGRTVVGYGATAKSATVTNYCGIGPDLVGFVCDSTVAKQGLLTPGAHLLVRPPAAFADPYPDYGLLFAWNHAAEIMAKEHAFRAAGGRWILYVPGVHVV
ncbi:methyltransferase domain-containing protein [Amycolatopsis sp. NPDC005003]